MSIPESLLEIREYSGAGYQPLIDYEAWRVAVLRFINELLPQNLAKMQRHNETDEVFVLLSGRCILFIGAGEKHVTTIHAQDMEPLKLYNVRRRCWHTHTLSADATILIVENRDTSSDNSTEISLDDARRGKLVELTDHLWKKA